MAEVYDSNLVPVIFEPYARDIAQRVAALKPTRVLEVAAGTGAVTRELYKALPDADILATDLNPAMIETGLANVPSVKWEQADAMNLPQPDDSFDVVVCQFGVMFFPDRVDGYQQVHRVLRANGTFVFNVWNTVESNQPASAVMSVLNETYGDSAPRFLPTVPHGYADIDRIREDVTAAAFSDVQIETVNLDVHVASARKLAEGFCRGTPLTNELTGDVDAVIDRIAQAIGDAPTAKASAHVITAKA